MSNNVKTQRDGWWVSYIPDQSSSILNLEPSQQDETALIIEGCGLYFILNGDWQSKYAECDTLEQAKSLFASHYSEFRSPYSDPLHKLPVS